MIDYLLASTHGGVRIRRADGETAHTLNEEDVRSLASDPRNGSVIYAGTQTNGIFKSQDGGTSWSALGLSGECVKSIAVSPQNSSILYAGTRPAMVQLSTDAGESWRELESFRRIPGRRLWWSPAESPWTAYVQGLAASPSDPGVVVAGVELGAVVRSTDGGETWSRHLSGSLRDCHTLRFHATDGDWVYEAGGTGGGASFSRDGGRTWNKARAGLDRNYAWACAADPERPDTWYISASTGPGNAHSSGRAEAHIFRSTAGEPWVKLDGGLQQPLNHMAYGLATVPGRPGFAAACLANGEIWETEDYGDSWRRLPGSMGPMRTAFLAVES